MCRRLHCNRFTFFFKALFIVNEVALNSFKRQFARKICTKILCSFYLKMNKMAILLTGGVALLRMIPN